MIRLIIFSMLIFSVFFTPKVVYAEESESTAEKKEEQKKTGKIYAIKDRYGNITGYTDDPQKGAEEVTIQRGSEYTPPDVDTTWSDVEPKVVEEPEAYTHFAIASPANDATIRDNSGNIQIALDIRPALQPGHSVRVMLDGRVVSNSRGVIQMASNVDRGTHNISAQIIGPDKQILKSSSPVTVHVHRATAGR